MGESKKGEKKSGGVRRPRVSVDLGEVEIEDGVPIPEAVTRYPWPRMKLAQSVVIPRSAASSARGFVKRLRPGWEVVERQVDADRVRVWFVLAKGAGGAAVALPGPETPLSALD